MSDNFIGAAELNTASIVGEISGASVSGEVAGNSVLGGVEVSGVIINRYNTIPIATTTTLGGVIVGDHLQITEDGYMSVTVANSVDGDNTHPITAAAVYTEVGNINALLATI